MDFSAEYHPNFYFKEFLAYTEDHCLVYNVFAYNIPKTFTKDDLARYFSRYGLIAKVRPFVDKKRSRRNAPNVAFINFVEASSAAVALQAKEHKIQNKRVYIKACDSWHQPKPNEDYLTGKPNEGMLKLNDDCLEAICRKLELCDQVRFARVCYRFREVFRLCCRLQFKSLNMEAFDTLTLWEARDFLEIAGPYVENISGVLPEHYRDRLMDFIGTYCCNSKIVVFKGTSLKQHVLCNMIANFRKVTDLTLCGCSLSDNALLTVRKLPCLKRLSLSGNSELTGKNIEKLQNLEKLDLYGCNSIQPAYIINAYPNFDDLRELDVRQWHCITTEFYTQMSGYFPKLEVLKIPCTDAVYDSVADLPSLKYLELMFVPTIIATLRVELFDKLAIQKADQLEALIIVTNHVITQPIIRHITRLTKLKELTCSNNRLITDECLRKFAIDLPDLEKLNIRSCLSVTDQGLLEIVKNCNNLKEVIAMHCTRITENFVYDAVKVLRRRPKPLTEPVAFYLGGSGVDIDALEMNTEECINKKGKNLMVDFSWPPTTDPNWHIRDDLFPLLPDLIGDMNPFDDDSYSDDELNDPLMDQDDLDSLLNDHFDDNILDDHDNIDDFYGRFDDLYIYAQNVVFGHGGW